MSPAVVPDEQTPDTTFCDECGKPAIEHGVQHPFVVLQHLYWGHVEVDQDIAPLIEACWNRGIETVDSCQDNLPAGYVWIEFLDAEDAEIFLSLVAGRYGSGVHNRLLREVERYDSGEWHYSARPANLAIRVDDAGRPRRVGRNAISFTLGVRFPHTDLPTVLKRLLATPEAEPQDRLIGAQTS